MNKTQILEAPILKLIRKVKQTGEFSNHITKKENKRMNMIQKNMKQHNTTILIKMCQETIKANSLKRARSQINLLNENLQIIKH